MYLFNKQEQLINVKGEHDFTEIHLVEKINTASQLTFSVVNPIAQNIQKVCVPAPRGAGFLMFKIITEDIKNDHIEYTCVESAYDELASYGYIRDLRPSSRSAEYILKEVLKETRWRLGTVYNTNNVSTNFYYEPILNCIQDIVSLFDLELTFTVAITGNKIVKRQVNMYSQQGERTGKRFEYGSNALEVEQETSTDELYTALVGRGKGEEVEGDHSDGSPTGYGRRITFADVVWKKSNGDALDKPKGQEYLEDPEATKLYGFADGSPRIGIVTFEDDTDKRLLLNHTYEKLLELERPQVRFKASVLDVGDLGLGDTVAIIRHDFHIEYFTRVFKVDHDLLDKNNNTIELGDDLSGNDIGSQVNDISNSISSMHQQISYVMAGASSDNQKVTYSPDQPADGSLGDLWYKDLGNGQTEMYIYNDGWQLVVDSSGTNQEVLDKVDQAMQDMADKEKEINDKLELNQIDISQAQADIEQDRQDTANQLADIRDSVAKDVADAKTQSKIALDKANGVDDKASQALENATEAKETATTVAVDMDTVKGEISSKADKSTVDTINQTVSDQGTKITQNANDIKSKASSSDVNELKGTVETNETLLEQTAQGLTAKADSSQLNKLSGDLTTLSNNFSTTSSGFQASLSKIDDKVNSNKEETDSALQVAKADIKATADNLSTNYTKTTDEHNYVNSQIKQSADKINLSVASVSDKVDGIQEWNKNYLTNTSDKEQTVKQSIWGDANELVHDIPQELFGTEITYSLHHISSTHSGYLYINIVDKDGNSSNKRVSGQMHYSADGFIEATFTIPADSQSAKTLGWKYDTAYAGNNLITYSSEKVEKGSKRTDWCPNDADTDSKIAALQIVDDQIKQTVSNKADTSYVDQKADQITSTVGNKADISYVDQQDNKIQSTVASKADASQITQLNDQINLKVSQSDFDNLEIGGRNLLPNSSFESSFGSGWSYSDMSNLFQKDGFIYIKKPNVTNSRTFLTYYVTDMSEYDEGEEYTFSIDFHTSTLDADGGSTSSFVRMLNANGSIIKDGLMSNIDPDKYRNGYTRFSGTGVIQKGTTKLQVTLAISGSVIGSFFVRHAKLEKGNKATDWTPAPEDKVDKDGLVSQINIDKSGVLIQGKKIMIDGDATIKNAVIKSSMIDTLDANKITAGTLNAANVHIINLDVSSLVGDTTSFVKSAWNGISDSVMIESGGIAIGSGLEGLALTSSGMHLFERHHGTDVGVISSMSVETYDNVNGLAFALNPNGNFMAWGYRDDYNSNFAQALTFFKSPGGWGRRGFTFSDDVRFDYGIYPAGGDRFNSDMLNINQILLAEDNHWYTGIGNETGETGVFFGKHQLLLKQNGIVYPVTGFKIPINIWKSNGAVKEWYNFATGTIESSDIK